jgi:hypothetical protein
MTRWIFTRLGPMIVVGALAGWLAAPALAGWKLNSTTRASIAYNQGITFDPSLDASVDPTARNFFFGGVRSTSSSGLYRTTSTLSRTASNTALIPQTTQGYNHVGDLTFDPYNRSSTDTGKPRVLVPLECYDPNKNPSNTCGSGAFGVVDPNHLSFSYYVRLYTPQIQKAMWVEISPDGKWIWTSSGADLLVYNAADVNKVRADNQLTGVWGGLGGKRLAALLPSGAVTGAAFYAGRLFLALNRGTYFQVVSYGFTTASDGSPALDSNPPTIEITVTKSSANNESEGLAVTDALNGSYPLAGVLHWQMLPSVKLYSGILNYTPSSGVSGASPGGSPAGVRCVVPKLKDRTLISAKTLLSRARCRLGKVTLKHSPRSRRGKVIAQQPKAGVLLPVGSRVALTLGDQRWRRR